ncbi:MAG: CBS domain-containing protein [Myxococcota bacterium]|jgi:CBS domain-containing protein|nr:CBS domain-containing protein [Myxococcota bacterium]
MTAASNDPLTSLTVRDLMTEEVIAAAPDTTLQEAIGIMVRRSIRHLPVIEDGEVVGVLSDRNIRVVLTEDEDFARRRGSSWSRGSVACRWWTSSAISWVS